LQYERLKRLGNRYIYWNPIKIELRTHVVLPHKMNAVYVIVENGQPYKVAYASFASAAAAVKEKHKYEVEAQLLEADGGPICSDIDVPEDKVTGKTYMYVEKEIHIYIYKLPVLSF